MDLDRAIVPISATHIRRDPMTHWDDIAPPARPYFLRRVSVFGPESTGKSTLATKLAGHFRTRHVPEYARTYIQALSIDRPAPRDMVHIAQGQVASEQALSLDADRLLICDTDPLATPLWSQHLCGEVSHELQSITQRLAPYHLTLLCDVDVPFVSDAVRYLPHARREFFDACRDTLIAHDRPFITLSGSWEERWTQAIHACESLIRMSLAK